MANSTRSLIIPVFKGSGHVPLLWETLVPELDGNTEIVFINDGSTQDIRQFLPGVERYEEVQIFSTPHPCGFSRAVNIGLRAAEGEYLFILNSDLILKPNTLSSLIQALQREPTMGMVSSKLIYPQTARIQHVGIAYSETNHFHVFRHAPEDHPLACQQRELQALAFALCCMPRQVYQEIGGLDEGYFNSYEDLDYCFRIRRLGKKLAVEPLSVAYHWERQSGIIRSVLRKDNVARLWRDWGREIQADLVDYLREACGFFKAHHMQACSQEYTVVNLSRGREADSIAHFLSGHIEGFLVNDIWDFGSRSNDSYRLWLPQILPVEAIRHTRPFIYLVDEFPQLDENAYWFNFRRDFVADEVLVDHNANVLSTAERF